MDLSETHTHTLITSERTSTLYNCLLRLFYSENHVAAPTVTVKIGNSHLLTILLKFDMGTEIEKKMSIKEGNGRLGCP